MTNIFFARTAFINKIDKIFAVATDFHKKITCNLFLTTFSHSYRGMMIPRPTILHSKIYFYGFFSGFVC
jgi:hypothetical protein